MNDTFILCVCVVMSFSAVSVCRLKYLMVMCNDCHCPDTQFLTCLTYKAVWHLTPWYLSMNPELCETDSLQTIWPNGTRLPRKLHLPQSPVCHMSQRERAIRTHSSVLYGIWLEIIQILHFTLAELLWNT